jgi:hypothetical protein
MLACSQVIVKLAQRNKLDPDALSELMLRMHEDAQVQLIWGLYQLEDNGTDVHTPDSNVGNTKNTSDT